MSFKRVVLEPETCVLLLAGLGLIGVMARWRKTAITEPL